MRLEPEKFSTAVTKARRLLEEQTVFVGARMTAAIKSHDLGRPIALGVKPPEEAFLEEIRAPGNLDADTLMDFLLGAGYGQHVPAAFNWDERGKPFVLVHAATPTERYGLDGEAGYLNGQSVPYSVHPQKAMGSWKTSWIAARKLAGETLYPGEGRSLVCRTHDLRHTAISRMLDGGVPIAKVAKIVGWSPSTMVKMAARYGHFSTDELRGAMETISWIEAYSPVFPRYRQK